MNPKSLTYAHRMNGKCLCGTQHGAEIRPIGSSERAEVLATYDYVDADGVLRYQVQRMQPKAFRQRQPDGRGGWIWNLKGVAPLIYRLPDVLRAASAGDTIWIVEGERDVHTLETHHQVATTNSGGAGKFPEAMAQHFAGADVRIVRDSDDPGLQHARDVYKKLQPFAKTIVVLEPKSGKDVTEHFANGHTLGDLTVLFPIDRTTNPLQWKRNLLVSSLNIAEPMSDFYESGPPSPSWPSGVEGYCPDFEIMRGLTLLSGGPSAGKSYLAMCSSIDAARSGWDVFYLVCEMPMAEFMERVRDYCGGEPPNSWREVFVGAGVSLDLFVEYMKQSISTRRTLIVFDSFSSFLDQWEFGLSSSGDAHGYALFKKLAIWILNLRRASQGEFSFLLLSELNREGRSKFRMLDHKADMSISMQSDKKDASIKHIRVVKGWRVKTGYAGGFHLNIERGRLERAQ